MAVRSYLIRSLLFLALGFIIIGYVFFGVGLQCTFADAIGPGEYYNLLNCGFPFSLIEYPIGLYNNIPIIPINILGITIGLVIVPLVLNSVVWALLVLLWYCLYRSWNRRRDDALN